MIKKLLRALFILTFMLSIGLNLFQWRNQAVTCENINTHWQSELLYTLGHKHLDGNKNGIPCENLLETK